MSYVIVIIIVLLLISWLISEEFYNIASMKGYKDRAYFWYCFLFGIAGYLMVVALPATEKKITDSKTECETAADNNSISDNRKTEYIGEFPKVEFDKSSELKQCPNCGTCHDTDLSICPSCNHKYN